MLSQTVFIQKIKTTIIIKRAACRIFVISAILQLSGLINLAISRILVIKHSSRAEAQQHYVASNLMLLAMCNYPCGCLLYLSASESMELFIEDALISVVVMSIFRFIWILITEDTNILQWILSTIISQ